MWRLALTLTLCCWSSEGKDQRAATCRDNADDEVDWFILYKAPGAKSQKMKYFYMDSKPTASYMLPRTPGYKDLSDKEGVLGRTLSPILMKIRDMPPNFGFISYSDQPPGCCSRKTFGHSKGVLMVERDKSGLWLLHSTPQFPFRRDQNNFWPDSGFKNAQIFICVTFTYDQFKTIGKHLQHIGAFPFEHYIPDDFHRELIDATKWVQANPPSIKQMLTSRDGQRFHSIAKQQVKVPGPGKKRPRLIDGDLYYTIAQSVNSPVYVQTWYKTKKDLEPSYCSEPLYKVYNIQTIKHVLGAGSEWGPEEDHSKWCVTKDQNKPWTCIGDVNRVETQYERRGGALCIDNEAVRTEFLEFAKDFEDCTNIRTPTIMDSGPDYECDSGSDPDLDSDSDCDSDPDSDVESCMGPQQ